MIGSSPGGPDSGSPPGGSPADGPAAAMARLLARRLGERAAPADAPLTVAELRRQLLPYPRCRRAADLASKAEYDLAVLALLAGSGPLVVEDPELAEAVAREREAAEPGLGFLDDFAASALRPGPELLERARGAASSPAPADESRDEGEDEGETDAGGGEPAAGTCRACGRELPGREGLRYCPWCGAEQGPPRCDDCREPLETDWSYCPVCGTAAGG